MKKRQMGLPRWLLIAGIIYCGTTLSVAVTFENKTGSNENNRQRIFSPRMDYDEWTPLGRGDPLKNDPTYDYVPPVLDRVQYWLDSHTTEASSKRDILVLGVTAKKTSPKIPEQFLKFVDGPKFTRNQESQGSYRNDFTGSTGAEPPKVIRTTNFRNGIIDYRNQNRIQSIPASYYSSPYYNQKSKPYTMMLPPPIVSKPVVDHPPSSYDSLSKDQSYAGSYQYSTQTEEGPVLQTDQQIYEYPSKIYSQPHPQSPPQPSRNSHVQETLKPASKGTVVSQIETIKSYTSSPGSQVTKLKYDSTTPSVSFEKSNLVYQSSQTISGGWLANNGPTLASSSVDANHVTWQTGSSPSNREHQYEEDDRQASGSSNHEVVIGQNANIIVEGDTSENEEVVIGQKEVAPPNEVTPTSTTVQLTTTETMEIQNDKDQEDVIGPSSSKMHIVLANSPRPSETTSDHSKQVSAVTVVMPMNYVDKKLNSTIVSHIQQPESILNDSEASPSSEMEKPMQIAKPQPLRNIVTSPPAMPVYLEDPSALSPAPMRFAKPYHQPPMRHPPPRVFGGTPPQHITHQQPSHARPAHVMMHYVPNHRLPGMGMGMGFRAPSQQPSGMPVGNMQPNMGHMQMQPPKTMMMGPPSMINIEQYNQPHRPYQHQPSQSLPITTTFTSAPLSLTSTGMNVIHDSRTEVLDQSHHHPQQVPEIVETTTTSPLIISSVSNDVTSTSSIENMKNGERIRSPLASLLSDEDSTRKIISRPQPEMTSTSASLFSSPIPTTTVPSLTTDPIFSHYKQPAKPIRGPMYLIIQGHSKVKTYKPSVNKHGIPVENNEILENTTMRPISKFEKFVNENTKRTGNTETILAIKKVEDRSKEQLTGHDSLLSLVESGFSAFTVPPPPPPGDLEEEKANAVTTVNIIPN